MSPLNDPPPYVPLEDKRREVYVNSGKPGGRDASIPVPKEATGRDIKVAAMACGLNVAVDWHLLGHNANGSAIPIADGEVPWHQFFTLIEFMYSGSGYGMASAGRASS